MPSIFSSAGTIPTGTATGPFASHGNIGGSATPSTWFSTHGEISTGASGSFPFLSGYVLGIGTPSSIFSACGSIATDAGIPAGAMPDEDGFVRLDEDGNIMIEE